MESPRPGLITTICYIIICDLIHQTGCAIPNTTQCCKNAGVNDFCVDKLCNIQKPPDYRVVFDVASKCPKWLPQISKCLADGRNHEPCCHKKSRGLENMCLHLCNGSAAPLNASNWETYKRYVACLSFNIENMFKCMRSGYKTCPGPPKALKSKAVGHTTATVVWEPPEKLPNKVKEYVVHYEIADTSKSVTTLATSNTEYKLTTLNPDTKYHVYVVAKADLENASSLKSDMTSFVTKGVAPKTRAYKDRLQASVKTTITLLCTVEVYGTQHISAVNLEWQKLDGSQYAAVNYNRMTTVSSGHSVAKYKRVSYANKRKTEPGQFVLALKISNFERSDVGTYKCIAKNNFGQDSSRIFVQRALAPEIPSRPANVTACCLKEHVHPSCMSTCQGHAAGETQVDAPPDIRCALLHVPKVLKCSTDGLNFKPCCLREGVQPRCLPFCDGSVKFPLPFSMYSCLLHTTAIFTCHLEAKAGLPQPPDNVQLRATSRASIQISWNSVSGSDKYVVYYRKQGLLKWHYKVTHGATGHLMGLKRGGTYEILVSSANEAGFSDNSMPISIDLNKNRVFYSH